MHSQQTGLDLGNIPAPKTLSKKAFAEEIGVSAGRVSQMVGLGLPVEPNGRIDTAKGKAWYAANIDDNRRRGHNPHGLDDFSSPKQERASAEAKMASLKLAQLQGSLIDRNEVERAIFGRARMERDIWIDFPSRASPQIAAALRIDEAALRRILENLVREQLDAISEVSLDDF